MRKIIWLFPFFLYFICNASFGSTKKTELNLNKQISAKPVQSIRIKLITQRTEIVDSLVHVIQRQIEQRCPAKVKTFADAEFTLVLDIKNDIGTEGFKIEVLDAGMTRITGNDQRGLVYGVGKFLRSSKYSRNGFVPGTWQGTSVPKRPMRGLYFATHFYNYYHVAPIDDITDYIEDLALWGYNNQTVWFDMSYFKGPNEPGVKIYADKIKKMLFAGQDIGISGGLFVVANESYDGSPAELRVEGKGRGCFYEVQMCPYKPGAKTLMLKQFRTVFKIFEDCPIKNVVSWPYDQGGCACEKCAPWGCNGYLVMAEPLLKMAKKYFPQCNSILSTWWVDEVEWKGLNRIFKQNRPDWIDYVMVSRLKFDDPNLSKQIPGNFTGVGFPEITMKNMFPWGGFGANPQPKRLKNVVCQREENYAGGFAYTEGIFEDLNKIIIAQLYWDPDRLVEDIVKEYIAFEFSDDPQVIKQLSWVIDTLENQMHFYLWEGMFGEFDKIEPLKEVDTSPPKNIYAEKVFKTVKNIDSKLSPKVRNSFRWRVIYLRAFLDNELQKNKGQPTAACAAAFEELRQIYYVQDNTFWMAKPPLMNTIKNK